MQAVRIFRKVIGRNSESVFEGRHVRNASSLITGSMRRIQAVFASTVSGLGNSDTRRFDRSMEFPDSHLHLPWEAAYIELSMDANCSLFAAVRYSDLLRSHRTNKRTVTNSYGHTLPANESTTRPRFGRGFFVRTLLTSFVLTFGATKSVNAQHCGRVAQAAVWMDSQLSWEREQSQFESARIRTSGCEGPMCRSRTPEPFSEPTSSSGAVVPLPWNCTSLKYVQEPVPFAGRILPDFDFSKSDPFAEPLFEPPRFD